MKNKSDLVSIEENNYIIVVHWQLQLSVIRTISQMSKMFISIKYEQSNNQFLLLSNQVV